jgi:hypothetical protein
MVLNVIAVRTHNCFLDMIVATETFRNNVSPWSLLNLKGIMRFYNLHVHASCTPKIQGGHVILMLAVN